MDIHNTVLALQVWNKVRVYGVVFPLGLDTTSKKVYTYKSLKQMPIGQYVVVPVGSGESVNGNPFAVARVYEDQTDEVCYDYAWPIRWITCTLPDVVELENQHRQIDKEASQKLAQSQARAAAEEHLNRLAIDKTQFEVFSLTDEKEEG